MSQDSPEPTDAEAGRLRVAITGASGLIGSALSRSLREDGHRVHPVVRRSPRPGSGEIGWDPAIGRIDAEAFTGVDAVVHLAGENVGERWTPAKKRRIRESRVQGTSLLARALASLPEPPRVLVSGSAIGYYGDRGDEVLREDSGPGGDFLAEVGQEWEAATEPAARAGIRVVLPRLGVVLTPDGGALERMLPPFRLGVGGKLGDGRQWMSWISLPDAVRVLRFAIRAPELSGPVNATAPEPVTNEEFTRALGRALGRPTLMRVPAAALRLVYGEMAEATLLASQRAAPTRLQHAGFRFLHPQLDTALRAVLGAR
jgi:uncharacterized protein (TIGR01777 family)